MDRISKENNALNKENLTLREKIQELQQRFIDQEHQILKLIQVEQTTQGKRPTSVVDEVQKFAEILSHKNSTIQD